MDKITIEDIIGIFEEIKDTMVKKRDELISLDSVIGDGDLGITMSDGFTKVCEETKNIKNEEFIGKFLAKSGMTMADAVPSTMGTLMATAIMKSGSSLKDKKIIETKDVIGMFNDVISSIEKRGKCKRGDKTLLDAIYRAKEEVEKCNLENDSFIEISKASYEGAKLGVEDTESMQSMHGKAACFGEKTIGHKDPGAVVIKYIFESINKYVLKYK